MSQREDVVAGCPVDHSNSKNDYNPFLAAKKQEEKSSCPVNGCDKINPSNMMEYPNQKRSSSQSKPLNTYRVVSSIPKGEYTPDHQKVDSKSWVYPSEQQYYNAMKRKGWDPKEDDMPSVVAIHNAVNEQGWAEVLKWESMRSEGVPKLVRFQGRPSDLSPKARLMNLIGYTLPFDRHDWIIDRKGKEVRYIIDFYSGKTEPGKPLAIHLDVRPALDSIEGVVDRLRMTFRDRIAPLLPFGDAMSAAVSRKTTKESPIDDRSTSI